MIDTSHNVMLFEAGKAKHKPHIILQILIFIAVMLITQLATGMIIGLPLGITVAKSYGPVNFASGDIGSFVSYMNSYIDSLPEWFSVLNLLATAVTTLLVFVYCRAIEGRSFASIGIRKKGMPKNYAFGYLIGTVMITAAAALSVLLGGAKFTGLNAGVPAEIILLFFLGYLVQGMSEEVCFRGYFMVSCANRASVFWAVLISSVVFAAMHLANQGISVLAFINLVLFGTFAAVYVLRTDELWGVCAIHSAWNFFQGNVFGISVSGNGLDSSVFGTSFIGGHELVSGGSFGIEGGICTTIVMLAGIALVFFLPRKPRQELPGDERDNGTAMSRGPVPVYIDK